MNISFFEILHKEQLITDEQLSNIQNHEKNAVISLHWELTTILYLGIVLLTAGLGVLAYDNIDSIGHITILGFIGMGTIACFGYCFKHKQPFSFNKISSPNIWFDYILLLGCLLLLTFVGYIQYQYQIFGNRLGFAIFIPMLILFFVAYSFDHLGVLSLAITSLAAWVGISITPLQLLKANDFDNPIIIRTAVILGIFLILVAHFSESKNLKAHFAFTYRNFGMHLFFIACLARLFQKYADYNYDTNLDTHNYSVIIYFLLFVLGAFYFYRYAIKSNSYYFMVFTVLYGYVALTDIFFRLISVDLFDIILPAIFYFIITGIGLILLLIHLNKKFKKNDRLQ